MDSMQTIRDHVNFRIILQAMSRPGKVFTLAAPGGEAAGAADLLGCLMDNEVSLAVIDDSGLEMALVLHSGCRVASIRDADFIVASRGTTYGRLNTAKRGSLEYPDTGATLLYLVGELKEAEGGVALTGPGIDGTNFLHITGVPAAELMLLRRMNSEFPLGVDTIFLDRKGCIACIPRSSQIGLD